MNLLTNENKTRLSRLSLRHWAIIEDVRRYRLMTPGVIQARHMPTLQLNAVNKVTARLVRKRVLAKYPLYHPRIYFTLGPIGAQNLGVSMQRTLPLGPQTLPTDYATMVYATTKAHQRRRLTGEELIHLVPGLPGILADFAYCLDETQSPPVFELVRVDLGGRPDHVARKCDADIEVRKPVQQLSRWMRDGRFRLVVITATADKAVAIRDSLSQHVWPTGLTIHLTIVPELIHLTASTYHGA